MADILDTGPTPAQKKTIDEVMKVTPLSEELVAVELDLAPHSDRLVLDGKIYFAGREYKVSPAVAAVMREAIFRGWDYEDKRKDEHDDYGFGHPQRGRAVLSGKTRRR